MKFKDVFKTLESADTLTIGLSAGEAAPFIFVPDVSSLEVEKRPYPNSAALIPKRASDEQIVRIKKVIKDVAGNDAVRPWEISWERKEGSYYSRALRPEEWRYFVLQSKDDDWRPVLNALLITEKAFGSCVTFGSTRKGKAKWDYASYSPGALFQTIASLGEKPGPQVVLAPSDIRKLSDLIKQMKTHDHQLLDMARPLELVKELQALPSSSPMKTLGYFAVLEAILTHAPKPDDRYDSITRQIQSKLALLNRRWPEKLDYSGFGETPHRTIWNKMYSYRSSVAHGAEPDFASELSVLKSSEQADLLIRSAVRATMRYGFLEPELIADLRNC